MGEVRVLLSNAYVHTGIRGLEGANQETSICVYNTVIQSDLGDKKMDKSFITKNKVMVSKSGKYFLA